VIERLEYGDAIGVPIALELRSGNTVTAAEPGFQKQFETLVHDINARWDTIRGIEKYEIGAINAQMEKLRLHQQRLHRSRNLDQDVRQARLQPLQESMAKLQAGYEELARNARDLRQQQEEDFLVYHLAT
jgi:ABC-type phosphate transport system auxiliary subunit